MIPPKDLEDCRRALTFSVGDSQFAIDVDYILAFTDDFGDINSSNKNDDGFLGYMYYRENVVRVLEGATVLSQSKERDSIRELIGDIQLYQKAHTDWIDALEHSIKNEAPFELERDPTRCQFGRWYYSFQSDDEDLKALLAKIEQPHRALHALAEELLAMVARGEQAAALEALSDHRQTTLNKVLRILQYVQEYLHVNIHPVVLHLTKDNFTPWFSLVLDSIGNMIEYDHAEIEVVSGLRADQPIDGYIRDHENVRYGLVSLPALCERAKISTDFKQTRIASNLAIANMGAMG